MHLIFSHRPSIDARLESRNSFIDHQLVSVSGVRLGAAFHRKLRMGGGVSWIKSDIIKKTYLNDEQGNVLTNIRYLKFVYLCYYIDFVFYKTKRWQLSVPIQAGGGYSWLQKRRDYYRGNTDAKYLLLLYEPGITAQFKVFKWFGFGADVAYRFAIGHSKKTGVNLNSPTYSFKIQFWFDQLFFDVFPKHELTKRFGPSEW
ncbi:MAG: hypothetical protein IT236_01810 [Bacteroidia bacterium]|nr:hypothetical protein [Bacteroidia bacterium]